MDLDDEDEKKKGVADSEPLTKPLREVDKVEEVIVFFQIVNVVTWLLPRVLVVLSGSYHASEGSLLYPDDGHYHDDHKHYCDRPPNQVSSRS